MHPCQLLTPTQLSAALGTIGATQESDMPDSGRGTNPLGRMCAMTIPGGVFGVSVGKAASLKVSTRELLDYMNRVYDGLKSDGWTYEKKDFGSTSCSLLTPPPWATDLPSVTICGTVVKEMLLMTKAVSKPSVPMEKLKTLAETAAARLP